MVNFLLVELPCLILTRSVSWMTAVEESILDSSIHKTNKTRFPLTAARFLNNLLGVRASNRGGLACT